MSSDYKKIFLIIFIAIFLVFLSAFQISFINIFGWKLNIFLVLVLSLIIYKNIYSALFLGWFGGFLIDIVHFSYFGTSSIILLITTFFLAIFQKKVLVTIKNEGILIMSTVAVFFYHFLELVINKLFILKSESLGFHLFNFGVVSELFFTSVLLLVIFHTVNAFGFNNAAIINKRF